MSFILKIIFFLQKPGNVDFKNYNVHFFSTATIDQYEREKIKKKRVSKSIKFA